MENAKERIDDDEWDALSTAEWVHEMCERGEQEEVDEELRQQLRDELNNGPVDVMMEDCDTIAVRTDSFVGSHTVHPPDGRGDVSVSEEGDYEHLESDYPVYEVRGPYDEMQEAAVEYHHGEHPGAAALTVGERNPGLGRRGRHGRL